MVSLIWAWDINRLIGSNQNLPWYYPEDLKYFKSVTLNKTVIMGRATFDSIMSRNNRPLPNRKNVVLSHRDNVHPLVETIHNLESYIMNHQDEDIFVIGGKSVFESSMPFADKLYITEISKAYQGDTYLIDFDHSQFNLISKKCENELCFCVYERKSAR